MHWIFSLAMTLLLLLLRGSTGSSTMNSPKPSISESVTSPLPKAGSGGTNNEDDRPPSSSVTSVTSVTSAGTEHKISHRISQTLESSLMSLTQMKKNSGDGSGIQEGHNELKQGMAPSVSLLGENMIAQELDEKRDWEDTRYHSAPPLTQRQIQSMDGWPPDITEMQTPQGVSSTVPKQGTSTQSIPTTTSTFSPVKSVSSDWQSMIEAINTFQKEANLHFTTTQTLPDIQTLNGKGSDDSMESNIAQGKDTGIVQGHSEDITPDGATVSADQLPSSQRTRADSSITTNPHLPHLQNNGTHMVTQNIQSHQTGIRFSYGYCTLTHKRIKYKLYVQYLIYNKISILPALSLLFILYRSRHCKPYKDGARCAIRDIKYVKCRMF